MIAPPPTPALTLPLRTPRAIRRPPIAAPDPRPRFTVDGSVELEDHLARTCDRIAAGVRGLIPSTKLEAILLGGGYGRGEGGVLRTPNGDRPYNDLEFYVCVRGNRHLNQFRFGRALHVLGEILTPQAGVEVEFKLTSLAHLTRGAVSMFSYDLVAGHRWLLGSEKLLAGCAHHRDAAQIPLSEATRLLMNRCSGLLFARERLLRAQFTTADADFVRRNIAKAQLALGDAVVTAHGFYHGSVRERHRQLTRIARVEMLPWLEDVRRLHAVATEFKLHPRRDPSDREALRTDHADIVALAAPVWLWLEELRLGVAFGSPRAYAESAIDKCPDTPRARNFLVNLRALGPRVLRGARRLRHPRERILHAMCLLLWSPEACTAAPLRAKLQHELESEATDFPGLMRAYRALWVQVN